MERFKKYFIDDKLMSKKDLCEYLYFKINRNVRFKKEEVERYLDSKVN